MLARQRVEERVIDLLQSHQRISLDNIAAAVDCDRRTVAAVMARLRARQLVLVVNPGRGNIPHQYQVNRC